MSEKKKNGCLKGCLVLVVLVVVLAGVAFFIVKAKGPQLLENFLDQAQEGVSYLLTEDHSDEERFAFENAIGGFIDRIKSENLRESIELKAGLLTELQEIIQDKRINRYESAAWVKRYLEVSGEAVIGELENN